MSERINADQIVRVPRIEKEYGIDNLKIYAYKTETELVIVGEIISNMISKDFILECAIYDADGDIIKSEQNESYGIYIPIKREIFFNGFPFRFSIFLYEIEREIGKIRIIPK